MKNTIVYSLITSAVLITGCSDSSSVTETPQGSSEITTQYSGAVADGYLSGATVCLDINANMSCEADEPSAISDSDGNYTLELTEEQVSTYPVVAIVTPSVIDMDNSQTVANAYTLVSPPGSYEFISPVTTLLALYAQDYSSESLQMSATLLREKLGLSEDIDLFADYIAAKEAGDTNSDDYSLIHNVAQLTARMMGQNLANFNDGNNDGEIDADELLVTVNNVIDTLEDLTDLAGSDDFDADAISLAMESKWAKGIEGIDPSEAAASIRSQYALPRALSGGVYQYIALDNSKSEYLSVKLGSTDASFEDQFTVTVSNTNGFSYSFTENDRTEENLDFDNQIAYETVLTEGSLVSDTYTFTITSTTTSATLLTDTYVIPYPQTYDRNLLEAGLQLTQSESDDALILSFPVEDDELYYRGKLLNIEGQTILSVSSFRRGWNQFWVEDSYDIASIDQVLVQSSDGSNHQSRNYIKESFKADVSESYSKSIVYWLRTYHQTASKGETTQKQEYLYQFNVNNPVEDISAPTLVPITESLKIEYFDTDTRSYVSVIDLDIDYSVIQQLGDQDVQDINGFEAEYSLAYDEEYGYSLIDAYFSSESSTIEVGTYRYSATDTSGETSYSYDYFGGISSGFASLNRSSFSADALSNDWYQLSIDAVSNGDVYYEFQINVNYELDGETEDQYLFNLGKTTENTALLSRVRLKEAVATFEENYSAQATGIFIDVSIYDGSRTYQIDNRYEVRKLDLETALGMSSFDDLLN